MDSLVIFRPNKTTEIVITPRNNEEKLILDLIPDQEENRRVTLLKRKSGLYEYNSTNKLQDVLVTITEDAPPQYAVILRLKTLLSAMGIPEEIISLFSERDQAPDEINSFASQFKEDIESKSKEKAQRTKR